MGEWIRRISLWEEGKPPRQVGVSELTGTRGLRWFELVCGAEETDAVLRTLEEHCPGLTKEMLEDLLTPDEQPEGARYANGVRLASSFSVVAWRPEDQVERGRPQGVGVLRFQPVELLAGTDWLITCWHPQRVFQGSKAIDGEAPGDADELFEGVSDRWLGRPCETAGDLGIRVMHELALTYAPAHRDLYTWLEDWELGLYTKDEDEPGRGGVGDHHQLPELWGLMAVLRSWLSPLNKPGLRSDLGKAWLPASDHQAVIEVDKRVDEALADLRKLSETLRQSFGLLHLEQTEEQRRHSERMQHRVELAATAFLVPTLIVGFYGANTWVPGQGRHWGFYVMVLLLVLLSVVSVAAVIRMQGRAEAARRAAASERQRMRSELLSSG